MELDTKQKILVAIYTEYQKDLPYMSAVLSPNSIGFEPEIVRVALLKLEAEGYITGYRDSQWNPGQPAVRCIDPHSYIMMTREGIDYVEQKLNIDPKASNREKVETVAREGVRWGVDFIKDVAARALKDMMGI